MTWSKVGPVPFVAVILWTPGQAIPLPMVIQYIAMIAGNLVVDMPKQQKKHFDMKRAYFIIITGKKQIDMFMKAADLFNGKNLGSVSELTVDYDENTSLSLERAAILISELKKSFEEQGYLVSFIHLMRIRNGDDIKINSIVKPYVDFGAREISDGKKSFVFKDFIELITPFKCLTNENYYITEII